MYFLKFSELFKILPRTKLRARDAISNGKYPFFTASKEPKAINQKEFTGNSLILPTGGNAFVHYCDGDFSISSDCIAATAINPGNTYTEYYYYYFKANLSILEAGFRGVGIKHITTDYIKNLTIPFPSYEEQKKNAELLNVVIGVRETIRESKDLLLNFERSLYEEYAKESKMFAKFPSLLANEVTWGKRVMNADSKSDSRVIPVLRSNAIRNNRLSLSELKYVDTIENGKLVSGGDIILVAMGKAGEAAFIPEGSPEMLLTSNLVKISVNVSVVHPRYLASALQSNYVQTQFRELIQYGNATSMVSLSIPRLSRLIIPIPSMELQTKYVSVLQEIDNMYAYLSQNEEYAESLFVSLAPKYRKDDDYLFLSARGKKRKTNSDVSNNAITNNELLNTLSKPAKISSLKDYKHYKNLLFERLYEEYDGIKQVYDVKSQNIVIKR